MCTHCTVYVDLRVRRSEYDVPNTGITEGSCKTGCVHSFCICNVYVVLLAVDFDEFKGSFIQHAGMINRYATIWVVHWSLESSVFTDDTYCNSVQVLSGDTVIVRGPPRGGPPPERTIGLSNVTAPRLARRPGIADESKESKDEVESFGVWQSIGTRRKDGVLGGYKVKKSNKTECKTASRDHKVANIPNCRWWGHPLANVI